MPPKRKADDHDNISTNQNGSGAQRKKQKRDAAREIKVQFTVGGGSVNAVQTRMDGLPSTIDVEKFTESRAFEIKAMQDGMESSKGASNQRVWQSLPRHLRRRAASHDVRRVPARLRERAKAEMDAPKVGPKKKGPRRGKEKRITRTEDFANRQKDKTWLETHIWHAKRMHMKNMWGYRLAETPTEKSFRPSHRASLHGCILHDASYNAIIEVKGSDWMLCESLDRIADPHASAPSSTKYSNGARVCYTHAYKPKSYPFDLIGPIEIIWQARESSATTSSTQANTSKGKEKAVNNTEIRVVWIRCHPSMYEDIRTAIHSAVKAPLYKVPDAKQAEIEVADLRDKFVTLELLGPKSSQVIHGALDPVKADERKELKDFWSALGQLQTAGSVPRGLIAGFEVLDPRLSFPPKNAPIKSSKGEKSAVVGMFPTSRLASSKLWDPKLRHKLSNPKFKKKDIDARKEENLIPGEGLKPLRQDARVPGLLIQHSVERLQVSHQAADSSRPLHGWTLILPKGWGMPFFSSLTHTGSRVGGQLEIKTQRFEAGCPSFPQDYPCTDAYAIHSKSSADEMRKTWERKPPAKRPNWEKLGTRNPWAPDWNTVLGLSSPPRDGGDLLPTQRQAEDIEQVNCNGAAAPWLLQGPSAASTIDYLSHALSPSTDLLNDINSQRAKHGAVPLVYSGDTLMKSALIMIRLSIPRSGSPDDNAVIYDMPDEEAIRWHSMVECNSDEVAEAELGQVRCAPETMIGYVTSGNYSLSIGRGQGIGAMPLLRYLKLREQLHRIRKAKSLPLVKVRNKESTCCRAAYVELLG